MKKVLMILFFMMLLVTPIISKAQTPDEVKKKFFSDALTYISKHEQEEHIVIFIKTEGTGDHPVVRGYTKEFNDKTVTLLNPKNQIARTTDYDDIDLMRLNYIPAQIQLKNGTVIDGSIDSYVNERIDIENVKNGRTEVFLISDIKKIKIGVSKQMRSEQTKQGFQNAVNGVVYLFSEMVNGVK